MRAPKIVLLVTLGLVPLVAHATDEFDFYFADMSILQAKEIQKDLGVTDAQRSAMNVHATWLNNQRSALESRIKNGKLTDEEANKQMAGYLVTLKKQVLGELTAAQLKRLREITLQRDGLLPLLDQKMADRLKIDATQLKTLRDAFMENDKKARALSDKTLKPIKDKYEAMHPKTVAERDQLQAQAEKELADARKKIEPDLEKIAKDFEAVVKKTLSQKQLDDFSALKGKPFKPS